MNSSKFEAVGNNVVIKYLDKPLLLIDPAHKLGLKEENKLKQVAPNQEISVIVVTGTNGKQFGVVVEQLDEIQYSYEQMNQDTIDVAGLKGSIFIKDKTICVLDIDHLSQVMQERITIEAPKEDQNLDTDYKQAA